MHCTEFIYICMLSDGSYDIAEMVNDEFNHHLCELETRCLMDDLFGVSEGVDFDPLWSDKAIQK